MFSAHRSSSQRYKPPVDDSCEESSIFSSDLETTSVADSEDDRRSRFVIIDCFVKQCRQTLMQTFKLHSSVSSTMFSVKVQ